MSNDNNPYPRYNIYKKLSNSFYSFESKKKLTSIINEDLTIINFLPNKPPLGLIYQKRKTEKLFSKFGKFKMANIEENEESTDKNDSNV